jgi:uncharacterized protein YjbI with pentapeptide repeats
MYTRKPMSHAQRAKIKTYIKNKLDISDLIEDWNIQGEDLTGAIISRFNRVNEDLRNTNFYRAIIGTEKETTNLSGCNLSNCNFRSAKFLGNVVLARADLRNSTFDNAWIPDVDFRFADLRNISLCNTVIRLGTKTGFQAKMSWALFRAWAKHLQVEMEE